MASTIVLIGAQRFHPSLFAAVEEEGIDGRIATITAGWQEREDEDDELDQHLKGRSVNLELRRRAKEIFAADPELAESHRRRQQTLRYKQDFYRIRLEHALAANHVSRQRTAPAEFIEDADRASLATIRALDDYHLDECSRILDDYDSRVGGHDRASIARHHDELATILEGCAAVAIAGGHVVTLLNSMRLLGVADLIRGKTLFVWAAGAIAVAERVVLFHDSPPQGPGAAEVLQRGLGLIENVVVLPDPESRLRLDDPERVAVLARRFSPALALAVFEGAHLRWSARRIERATAVVQLCEDGNCAPLRIGA